jgi:hypothetical protein
MQSLFAQPLVWEVPQLGAYHLGLAGGGMQALGQGVPIR